MFRVLACKRKEDVQNQADHTPTPKKPRLVFTDLQRRTLQAIFKVSKVSAILFSRHFVFPQSLILCKDDDQSNREVSENIRYKNKQNIKNIRKYIGTTLEICLKKLHNLLK